MNIRHDDEYMEHKGPHDVDIVVASQHRMNRQESHGASDRLDCLRGTFSAPNTFSSASRTYPDGLFRISNLSVNKTRTHNQNVYTKAQRIPGLG